MPFDTELWGGDEEQELREQKIRHVTHKTNARTASTHMQSRADTYTYTDTHTDTRTHTYTHTYTRKIMLQLLPGRV